MDLSTTRFRMGWWLSTTWGATADQWDATLRTDVERITKKDLGRNAKNLNYFDTLVLVSTTGELDLDDSQKTDMMSFIKDDGKRLRAFMRSTPTTNGPNTAR